MIKLWHDDVRKPPSDEWVWAKTNKEAREILDHEDVTEISLDHDLGAIPTGEMDPTEVMYLQGHSPDGTGLDLVRWMCSAGIVPEKVTVHSWNPDGAKRMAQTFELAGYHCVVKPFEVT